MPAYRCPVCGLALGADASGVACANGHRYDRARDGYVNLLPAGRVKGRPAGDSDPMVKARRAVFDAGLYDPIIAAVAARVAAEQPADILDAGCGEGAYLAAAAGRSGAPGWGIDVSKAAVRLAARRHRDAEFAVASSYALPFEDRCFDVILSVFSPRPHAEMMRVLRPGGIALLVSPGMEHLHELKAMLYDDARPHTEAIDSPEEAWPEPDDRDAVRFEVALGEPSLRLALLAMTPFLWSATPDRQRTIAETVGRVTVDMRITVSRRSA